MAVARRLFGLILILGAGYVIFDTFQTQILGEAVKTQIPDFLDFFVDTVTPEITQTQTNIGIVAFVVGIIGLILLLK